MTSSKTDLEKQKVNLETSQIKWRELQRFFAQGLAIYVAPKLDLVDVAYQFSNDNKLVVQQWMDQNKVNPVSDSQAKLWLEQDATVWAVVVKPWILVQPSAK